MLKNESKIEERFKSDLSNWTISQYEYWIEDFQRWLREKGRSEEEEPEALIQDYTDEVADARGLRRNSVSVVQSALKKYFRKVKQVDVNPKLLSNTGEVSDYEPKLFSRDEVSEVMNAVDDDWREEDAVMFHTQFECALRSGEVCRLKPDMVFEEDSTWWLQSPVLKTRRGRDDEYETKKIPLTEDTAQRIMPFVEMDERWLFLDEKNYKWIKTVWSSKVRVKVCETLGLDPEKYMHKHLCHNFMRNTRLTQLAEDRENDFLDILQISGHQSPKEAYKYFKQAGREVDPELKRRLGV